MWRVGTSRYEEEVATPGEEAFYRSFQRKLGAKGLLSTWWPVEYGGRGHSKIESAILREELAYYGAPGLFGPTYELFVPMMLAFGTEEQKRRFLPPLARGEWIFCQGFSEPDAGSDLASLKSRAVEKEDGYVLDGHKVWVSAARICDWGFFLFRTDEKATRHRGLSMFLVELSAPGITRKTVNDYAGLPAWQEIFFDGVRVPKENLLGGKNNGWQVAMYALNHERSGLVWLGTCRRALDRLVTYVKERKTLAEDSSIREKLAALAVEVETARLACYYVASMQDRGVIPVHEASVAKILTCHSSIHLAEAGLEIMGEYGLLDTGSPRAPFDGGVARTYLSYPMWVLGGGSLEIQKEVIARLGLGLPKLSD
jgi:alkylation response protein AidB-like acyl-CoA dehydrogenase